MIENRYDNYAKTIDMLGNFISQVKAQAPQTDLSVVEDIYKNINAKYWGYRHIKIIIFTEKGKVMKHSI